MPTLPLRRIVRAVLAAAALAATAAPVLAQGDPAWQLEDVATLHPVPGCVRGMTLGGFDHDPEGRPVLAWREENDCGGTPRVFWTRKEDGSWNAREFFSGNFYGGGAKGDFSHTLVLRPSDGNPFLVFRDVGLFNSLYSYRADLGANPTGGGTVVLEYLVGAGQCATASYSLAFAPGGELPEWASGHYLCNDGGYVRLDGFTVGSGYRPSPALAVTPDGTRHILWNSGEELRYSRVAPGAEPAFASTLLFSDVNRFGGEVALVSDASGVLHAVVRGVEGREADWDRGAVVYFTSADGGQTWTVPEHVDPNDGPGTIGINHDIAFALGPDGVPTVTYWRATSELWLARRDGPDGSWTQALVASNSGAIGPRSAKVDFDAAGRVVIAFYDVDAERIRLARQASGAEPPTLTLPSDRTAEATAPAGAAVEFAASAIDSHGIPLPVTCAPASGSLFAIGTTAVTCSATDGDGLSATGGFTITVADTTAPTLTLPADITVEATEDGGAPVTFAASAVDAVDGATTVECVPASGSLFAVATTTVTCSSTDSRGHTATGTFHVTVEPPAPVCLPAPDGLAAWWSGEGTATDTAGGRPGVAHGGVTYGPGMNGRSFVLDGTSGYVEVPTADDNDLYPQAGAFTLSAWVKTTSLETLAIAWKDECSGPCASGGHPRYGLILFQGFPIAHYTNTEGMDAGNLFPEVVGTRSIADGSFHHVALVREPFHMDGFPDAAVLRLYVDGRRDQLEVVVVTGSVADDNGLVNPFTLGGMVQGGTASNFFDGAIDDVTFHRRALSEGEIHSLYVQRLAGRCHGSDNRAPILVRPPDQSTVAGVAIAPLALSASDPDGDTVGYSASGLPLGIGIDFATGILEGTPLVEESGGFNVTVLATDGSLGDTQTFTWTVAPPNHPPVITSPGDQTTAEQATVALPIAASDADGDVLTFAATGLPPGLAIDGGTGVVAGTPGYQAAGQYAVTLSVSDGKATATAGFAWTVTNVVCHPVATADAATTTRNTPVEIRALDNDISPTACGAPGLTVSAVSTPGHGSVVYDNKTGAFTYTPGAGFTGTDSFTYTVTNADGGSATATVTITVTGPANHAPVIAPLADRTGVVGDLVNLSFQASDPDHDRLTFSATGLPRGLGILPSTGRILGLLPPGAIGTHTVVVSVSDGQATTTATFAWTVVSERTLSIDDVTVVEAGRSTTAVFTVTLSVPSPQKVSVRYATEDRTARAGSDYVAERGTVIFAAGQTTRTITIGVRGDRRAEPDETFVVELSLPLGARLARARGVATITEPERPVAAVINVFETIGVTDIVRVVPPVTVAVTEGVHVADVSAPAVR